MSNQDHLVEPGGQAKHAVHDASRRRGSTPIGRVVLGILLLAVLVFAMRSIQAGGGGPTGAFHHVSLPAPTNLYATGLNGAIVLSWQPPLGQPKPIGYRVYRALGRHGPFTIIGSVNAPDIDTFTDSSDLVPGMTYAYTVTAFDRRSESVPIGPIIALLLLPASSPSVRGSVPLPTFSPPAPATITAVARMPKRVSTPAPTPSKILGVDSATAIPTTLPAGSASTASPVR